LHFKDNWNSELKKVCAKLKADELLILNEIKDPDLPISEICSKLKIISEKMKRVEEDYQYKHNKSEEKPILCIV
jgi:hypothetical protein